MKNSSSEVEANSQPQNLQEIEKLLVAALEERAKKLPYDALFDKTEPEAFVDNKQIETLHGDNWHIVFGRRGAGKTTMLSNYAKQVTSSNSNQASIELSVDNFKPVIIDADQISAEIVAIVYFRQFLAKIADHLSKVISERNDNSKFFRLFKSLHGQNGAIDRIVRDIKEKIESTQPLFFPEKVNRQVDTETHSERDLGGSIGGKLEPVKLQVGGEGSWKISNKNKRVEKLLIAEKLIATIHDFYYIKELLLQLLQQLNLKTLVVIIDEWSALDVSARTGVQEQFASLLKRVFGTDSSFRIKIGSVRHQTKLFDEETKVGLELDDDIYRVDLDDIYNNSKYGGAEFFKELIYKHLSYCAPPLKRLGEDDKAAAHELINCLFLDVEAFETLISGAGRLPRDFLVLFDSLARKGFSINKKWNINDVRDIILENFYDNKPFDLKIHDIDKIYHKMIKMIKLNKSRLLLVPKESRSSLKIAIAEMYHNRLIHYVESNSIPADLRSKFDFYNIDLGIFYDAIKALKIGEKNWEAEACIIKGDEFAPAN